MAHRSTGKPAGCQVLQTSATQQYKLFRTCSATHTFSGAITVVNEFAEGEKTIPSKRLENRLLRVSAFRVALLGHAIVVGFRGSTYPTAALPSHVSRVACFAVRAKQCTSLIFLSCLTPNASGFPPAALSSPPLTRRSVAEFSRDQVTPQTRFGRGHPDPLTKARNRTAPR